MRRGLARNNPVANAAGDHCRLDSATTKSGEAQPATALGDSHLDAVLDVVDENLSAVVRVNANATVVEKVAALLCVCHVVLHLAADYP